MELSGALQQCPTYTSLAVGTTDNLSLRKGRSPSRSLTLHFTYPPSLAYEVIRSVKERVKTHWECFPWLPLKVSIPLSFLHFFFNSSHHFCRYTQDLWKSSFVPQYVQAVNISLTWDPSCVPGTGTRGDWRENWVWCFHNQPTEPHSEKVHILRQKQCPFYQKIIQLGGL